jgi:hypothetical protein
LTVLDAKPVPLPALGRIQQRILALHHGIFQPEDYLDRWCSPPIAELFDRYAVRLQPQHHTYVHGVYGPRNCIKNALHYATANPEASPWWAFALYFDDDLRAYTWWLHSFCLSEDGGTLFDPTVPPQHAPEGAPAIFCGIPWGIELFNHLATSPVNPDTLPPFLARSIFPVLDKYAQSVPAVSTF